ncbi:hypothetical protein MNBD_GAMMA10-3293 [hydrothermal vent metagenome]|uniref:Hemolysin activator protein, HlyB family n=1 Tax=hydrothermal vent metagenome TaxID=652676 RepID=A0A3B0YLZ6_9ZZZZ
MFFMPFMAWAGFFEMPDITQFPELKRESLLQDMDIPSVRDRDPDPESGSRLNVRQFKLQGIVEFPELGITKKSIDKQIERIRFELMQEYELLESGYTQVEVNEVIDLLVDIEKETLDRHATDLELQKLIWLIRQQRSERGITLGAIETVADKLTQYYREQGFILAKAYIPEQKMREGVVTMALLLGMLGKVEVRGNELYEADLLSSVFSDQYGLPVTGDKAGESLYLINDFPGLSVTGLFEPGTQVGDTQLNLNVRAEKRYHANVRYDNHGSDDTGEQRVYAEVLLNNLAGVADLLHLGALSSFSPDNTTYWQLRYSFNLWSPRWRLGIGRSQNQFIVAQNDVGFLSRLPLSGETIQSDVSLIYKLKRSRVENYTLEFSAENILSDIQLGDIADPRGFLDDEIRNYSLLLNYDILQERGQRLHQGVVRLTSGEFIEGAAPGQNEKYTLFNADYTLLSFAHIPWFDMNTRFILRSSLQFADSPLSSISQFLLGGPTRARGYSINQFSADNAVYLGADWVLNFPTWLDFELSPAYDFRDIAQPFFFIDAAYGVQKALLNTAENSEGRFYDAGLGVRFSYRNQFQGNLQLAFPLSSQLSDEALEPPDDNVRLVFDFQYSF